MTSLSASELRTASRNQKGFTLIELLMVITLLAILSVVSISIVSTSADQARFDQTVAQLKEMRNALVGDPSITQGGNRTSFGYAGDVGALPSVVAGLSGLLSNPAGIPAFSIDAARRFGAGWNGPYMNGRIGGTGVEQDISLDAWGNALVHDFTTNPATLTSRGADGAVGGTGVNQDVTVSISSTSYLATVYGFVSDHGVPVPTAEVVLSMPDGSGTITDTLAAAPAGYFNFTNVPFGKRSITIYIPDQATATQTVGPILLTVDKANFACSESQLDINP